MPGPGEQHRGAGAVLGLVGQQRVPELVQGPAVRHLELLRRRARIGEGPGRELEGLIGTAVGQPGPAGDGAQVPAGDRAGGPAQGEEHRALAAAGQQPGQQKGGAGLPVHPVGGAALGDDAVALAGHVEVGDVQAEDLLGAGGGLVQHPPQRLIPQRHVQLPDRGDLRAGQRPGGVDRDLRPGPARGRVGGHPAGLRPPGDGRSQRRQVPGSGRRGERPERGGERGLQRAGAGRGAEHRDVGCGSWRVTGEAGLEGGEGLPVLHRGALRPRARRLVRDDEGLGRVAERRRREQTDHARPPCRRKCVQVKGGMPGARRRPRSPAAGGAGWLAAGNPVFSVVADDPADVHSCDVPGALRGTLPPSPGPASCRQPHASHEPATCELASAGTRPCAPGLALYIPHPWPLPRRDARRQCRRASHRGTGIRSLRRRNGPRTLDYPPFLSASFLVPRWGLFCPSGLSRGPYGRTRDPRAFRPPAGDRVPLAEGEGSCTCHGSW